MADSTLGERSSISGSDYSDFEASMNMMKGFMNLLRKSGLGNLNHQDERNLTTSEILNLLGKETYLSNGLKLCVTQPILSYKMHTTRWG